MGVLDGQAVSASVTNPAFINKNQDDTMSNKLTFNRSGSGTTVSDIQAAVNKLYTCTGASESATGTVYNAPANTITDGDSHETALGDLADKFDPATGHMHTGAAGDAPPLPGTSISDVPLSQFTNSGMTLSSVTGSTYDVTSILSAKTPSTGSTDPGVVVTTAFNKVLLANAGASNNTDCFVDSFGNLVYGRLTESTGTWTLSFYSLVSGVETSYSFSSAVDINWYYRELYEPLVSTPVYDYTFNDFEFKNVRSVAATGFSPLYGDLFIAGTGGVTVSQSDQTILITGANVAAGVTSIAASGYAAATGDITLIAGTDIAITQSGTEITISASGGTNSPLTTKGDLYGYDTDNARIPVGNDGSPLIADSNVSLGVRYQDPYLKNYILENDAEINATTGYATYADAAGPTPVNGTGGSPNITFAVTGSSPISGLYSYLISKDAADRQGEGVSYDFDIDNSLQAQVLEFSFDYEPGTNWVASSGGISVSDISIYIYDVTNSALIPVQPLNLTTGVGYQGTFVGTFQTAINTTSLRAIWHIATTNANAWTFKFDNVRIGKPIRTQGTPITDWTSYNPIISGFGTTTNVEALWRRVGGSAEIHAKFTAGTVVATEAQFGLPSVVSADTSRIPSIQLVGSWTRSSAAGVAQADNILIEPSTSYLTFAVLTTTTGGLTKKNGNDIIGNNETVSLFATVPIAGWSSQTEMSSGADTRLISARTTGSGTSFGTLGATLVPTTINNDTTAMINPSTGLITIPVSGFYIFGGYIRTASSTTYIQLYYSKNGGSDVQFAGSGTTASQTFNNASGSFGDYFTAGDTIAIKGYASTSVTADVLLTYVQKVSGPATIAANETVAARFYNSALNHSIGTSFTTLIGNTKSYDTHNALTVGTGLFTAPMAGKYRISFFASSNTVGSSVGDIISYGLIKNGSAVTGYGGVIFHVAIASQQWGAGVSDTIQLLAGDTIGVQLKETTHSFTLNIAEIVTIERVGN